MSEERLLFRVPEAAAVLGLSRAKVNMMLASGEIDSIKVGRARRIPADALRDFVEDRRRGGCAPAVSRRGAGDARP